MISWLEIKTSQGELVTINPLQIVSVMDTTNSTVRIVMPGVTYYIDGTKLKFLERLFSIM